MRYFLFISILFFTIFQACNNAESNNANQERLTENYGVSNPQPENGKTVYKQFCQTCHGADGTLGIGGAADLSVSSLNDEELKGIIKNGRNTMIGYKDVLNPAQIDSVTNFVRILRK